LSQIQNQPPRAGRLASISSDLGSSIGKEAGSSSKPHQKNKSTVANVERVGVVLRPYQALDVVRMRKAYGAGASRICYQLPTGGGKTIVFAFVAASAVQRGRRVMILGHRQEITEQISAALTVMDVSHGIIAPGHPPTTWPVQVASVLTIAPAV
jgi:DNA repair protein RadD